ncbi:hypothetical protein B0H34DRAFT_735187 [Crassisporium funariophilum]|nr:hypothetical protein B0H34DRAFT_735187 [Crassisporium funariophilum]
MFPTKDDTSARPTTRSRAPVRSHKPCVRLVPQLRRGVASESGPDGHRHGGDFLRWSIFRSQ